MVLIFNIYTEDNKQYDETFLQNYANINLIPQVKRVKGVGQAMVFGIKDYSMRIWLNPQKMSSYGLEPADVSRAIADHSLESAPGKLGEESHAALEYVIRYKGKKNKPEQYEDIVVKNTGNQVIRLKDVARVNSEQSQIPEITFPMGKMQLPLLLCKPQDLMQTRLK